APEEWIHLCHVIRGTQYTIFFQGQEWSSGPLKGLSGFPLNGTVILGQEQDKLAGGFDVKQVLHGDISQVNIWKRSLNSSEVWGHYSCTSQIIGDMFSSDREEFEVVGDITDYTVETTSFCRKMPHYIILTDEQQYNRSSILCNLINGTLAVPKSTADNSVLFDKIKDISHICSPTSNQKAWLGITDTQEEGTWKDTNGESIIFNDFQPPFPAGGSNDNCGIMLQDGSWGDWDCDKRQCGACELQRSVYLRLRGLCFDDEHYTRFRVDGIYNNRTLYIGYYYDVIFWDSDSKVWVLQSIIDNSPLASTSALSPLGKQNWFTNQLLCDLPTNTVVELSLSACLHNQFMCNN
ncbi:unnamed protein product, partial [Meganyctiphanes norvegica]